MLNVKHNIAEVLSWTDRFSRQYEFAVASALTDVVRDIARAMPAEVDRASEGGATRFTRQGFEWQRAEKMRLTASVAIRPMQAEYLRFMVDGGTRVPRRKALRLPAEIALTAEGNLPAGTIRRLVAQARRGKGMTRAGARRIGAAQGASVLYGTPAGRSTPGLYLRTPGGGAGRAGTLTPLVQFPAVSAKYPGGAFQFYAIAGRMAVRLVEPALRKAWARAKATAR